MFGCTVGTYTPSVVSEARFDNCTHSLVSTILSITPTMPSRQNLSAGLGILINGSDEIVNTKPMCDITVFDNGVTEYILSDVAAIRFPTSWTYLYSNNVLHLYQPSIRYPPNILVIGTTFTPAQISTISWGGALGSLSSSTLTMTPQTYSASYGFALVGNTFSATRGAPVLTIDGYC